MANPQRTALIVVDMQNAFVGVAGFANVVEEVNRRVAEAVTSGWPVYYTRDIDPTGRAATGDGHNEALHADVDVKGTIVEKGPGAKGGFSGFVLSRDGGPGGGGLSSLAQLLGEAQVNDVVVIGVAADVCVASTAVDAVRLGYAASVDLDATAFVHAHPQGDSAAVEDLRAAGVRVIGTVPT